MHLKLQHVVSDLTGETGMAIMRAILAGERDPLLLARLRNDRCHHDEETIAKALCGQWREEHLFAVAQALALYAVYHQQIVECDREMEAPLGMFAERHDREALPPVLRARKWTRNRPHFDVRGSRHRITGVDLTAIEGIDEPVVS